MKRFLLFFAALALFTTLKAQPVNTNRDFVTVTIGTLNCLNQGLDSVLVKLVQQDPPYQVWTEYSDPISCFAQFDTIPTGTYNIISYKRGYRENDLNYQLITSNYTTNVKLVRQLYPVRNLHVDSLTSEATWDKPLITALSTGFEAMTFPPYYWQIETDGEGWYKSSVSDSMFNNWTIPSWPGHYAITNHDYSTQGGSYDYFITNNIDLRESDQFKLYFDSYYDSLYGGTARVEYTSDNGNTWLLLKQLSPDTVWQKDTIDLSFITQNGIENIKIRFNFTAGNGPLYDGWAIDNVSIHEGEAWYETFYLFDFDKNNGVTLPHDQFSYSLEYLEYGNTYTISVKTYGECFCSDRSYFTWVSRYLYPPRNIHDNYIYNSDMIPFLWNPPVKCEEDTITGTTLRTDIQPRNVVSPVNETAPNSKNKLSVETKGNRDTWDLQFAWPPYSTNGESGIESDGDYIYTTHYNSNIFSKYMVDGTWIEDFTISGVSNIRDLAYDGQYFYGAAADYTVYKMDFNNHLLIGTIQAPVVVRAIAYNCDNNTFYANNWSTDITEFTMTGTIVSSFSTSGYSAIYGLAYDNSAKIGPPSLWLYDQGNNNLIQLHLPSGQPSGVTIDVESIAGTTSAAGGLFIQNKLVQGTVTIGGMSQNDKIWGLELARDTICHIPYGLLSYNIYRDGTIISNVPYNNEPDGFEYTFTDVNVMPGTYYYQASALYDLEEYGYPGETGESMLTPIDTVTVIWGYDLPFTENWDLGSFDFNNWTPGGTGNWVINNSIGDDTPSAEFKNIPHLENSYESCLTSSPIKADSLTEGNIWIDFNLKLDDLNETGDEHLSIEVYNGNQWHQVYDVANNGSFDFEEGFAHINISNYTLGKVFQIRFKANGQNSTDLNSWYIDNINIYRTCDAPSDLAGEYFWEGPGADDYGVQLEWEAPTMPMGPRWIFWGYGENSSAIGLNNGGDFSAAARWDSDQVAEYVGGSIVKIEFYIQDTDYSNLILKVWKGAEASNLVYSEDVTSSIAANTFNEFTLSSPVLIEEGDEIWIGYTILGQEPGVFPAGTDAGPAFAGNGDKITTDGVTWENLTDFGYDMNWNIAMHIETIYFNPSRSQTKTDRTVYSTPGATLSQSDVNPNPVKMKTGHSREFDGFTIYRSETGYDDDYLPYTTVPYTGGKSYYSYKDLYPNVNPQQTYWYKVSANWSSDMDNCESEFAKAQLNPENDFIEVFVTGVNELQTGSIMLYPNPATDNITITSTQGIENLTVFNATGQMIEQKSFGNKQQLVLNTSKYDAGVYYVKIETRSKTNSEKIVKRFVVIK